MADVLTKEQRHRNMQHIRSADTGIEVTLRKALWQRGYRYRKNDRKVFGKPDMYFSKYHAAVFVNGCYWHRHAGCPYAYMPKSNQEFWKAKFQRNIDRDNLVRQTLLHQNIRVLIVWECTIKKDEKSGMDVLLNSIEDFLHGTEEYEEL